jgi:Na+-translocating ferredoxin:NAD+ oxidoreductase RNF subunit RnfB
MSAALIPLIDALLPQTQCGKCGHAGCLPYAEELSAGGAINKCPPGGSATIHALAELLGRPVIALDPAARQRAGAPCRLHSRSRMHRLHQVHSGLPGGRHHGGLQTHAHRHQCGVHGL